MAALIEIEFSGHISLERVRDMLTAGAAAGNVTPRDNERQFIVEIPRPARLAGLKRSLEIWERAGYAKWREVGKVYGGQ